MAAAGPRTGDSTPFTRRGVYDGFRRSLPVAAGVFTYGVVFGILARQTPLSAVEALVMSAAVFAASAQFVVLDLWSRPIPVTAIVVTTFLVNLRHVLMGASLYRWLARLSRRRVYGTLFLLNDESWGLAMRARAEGERDAAFLLGSGLVVFLAWVSASLLGLTAGSVVSDPARYGLDFAFVAVYVALLVGVWEGRPDLVPVGTAAAVAVAGGAVLPGNWHIVAGGVVGSLAGVARDAATGRGFAHARADHSGATPESATDGGTGGAGRD
ncbi:branched-chain amino acid ABC transporter permease [Halobacteriales archaeon QS_1_68_17]|nr:MAG: branched-chain amino acid ABC transporter permease [Halobacteriales archaeon QS_1_68_17]